MREVAEGGGTYRGVQRDVQRDTEGPTRGRAHHDARWRWEGAGRGLGGERTMRG